jgi:hypothetical protein
VFTKTIGETGTENLAHSTRCKTWRAPRRGNEPRVTPSVVLLTLKRLKIPQDRDVIFVASLRYLKCLPGYPPWDDGSTANSERTKKGCQV